MQPFSGNQRLTLNLSAEYVSCTAPATQNASLQILFKHLTPANFLKIAARPQRFAHFGRGAESHVPATPKHTQTPKSVREWCVLYILTSTCASRHNGVHFFDIATSKSGPNPWCFVHFDLEMCFAPQRRALFRHLNFQKWSEPLMFLTF